MQTWCAVRASTLQTLLSYQSKGRPRRRGLREAESSNWKGFCFPLEPSAPARTILLGYVPTCLQLCLLMHTLMRHLQARREVLSANFPAHAHRASEQQLPALPTKPGHLAVSLLNSLGKDAHQNSSRIACCLQVPCLNLPQFLPNSSSLDDVSYRKDTSFSTKPTDLLKLQRPDASAFSNDGASVNTTAMQSARLLPVVPVDVPANAVSASARASIRSSRAKVQLGTSSNAEKPVIKSNQHGAFDNAAAQLKWPSFPTVFSPQQTSRLAQQQSSWQLSSAAGTAPSGISPSSNNLAAKSWQQVLSTASAHEQWVAHKHTAHGTTFDTGNEEEWGQLLVRVPQQDSKSIEKLMQQLPQALAGSVHTQPALQVCHQHAH